MKKYYFTFGFDQGNNHCYIIIEAENREEARRKMCRRFGSQWGFQYDSAEEAGVEKFNLREIKYMKYKITHTGKTMNDEDRGSFIVEGNSIPEIQKKTQKILKSNLWIGIYSEKIEDEEAQI